MSADVAVDVVGLVKVYSRGVRGVDGLSFRVARGEIYGLVGPNGSGKTTTLRIIATLLKPTEGSVRVFGLDVVSRPLEVRRLISYLPEEAGAYRDLSGVEFVKFMLGMRLRGRELGEAVEEAIEIADLGSDIRRPVRSYSKGMKRLLALSAALASRSKLVILDEPTSGLDVERSIRIRNLIASYSRRSGVTVLLSSHNMLEVEYLCDRVGILYRGRMVAEGPPEELKARYSSRNLEEVFVKTVRGE
ncbi:MAG: ABC transporter ATP-binding protein [Sulfolobales archaeon]|nr:ABC transporter ATP-binding protein [Sulfolobales archaeon]